MPYITSAELSLFISLNAVSDLPDASESDAVAAIIVSACGECDGYLASVASVPLASPSELIKLCAKKIAYRYVIGKYQYASQQDVDTAQKYYDEAVDVLMKIARGELPLGDGSTATPSPRLVTNAANLRKIQTITAPSLSGTANQYTFSPDEND